MHDAVILGVGEISGNTVWVLAKGLEGYLKFGPAGSYDSRPPRRANDRRVRFLRVHPPAANAVRCTGSHAAHHYAPVLTLAFIGTLMSYTPFPLADVASTWLALVRTCRLALPAVLMDCLAGEQARLAHVAALRAQLAAAGGGDASLLVAYHVLGPAERGGLRGDVREEVDAAELEDPDEYARQISTREMRWEAGLGLWSTIDEWLYHK
ncbi:hypothetical protein GGX14DRAFT_405243 [Mycena pura]|uniref:Uncharacterized protein n=1 Tax=Mycena pura TaxID=153505 RepID=A0AAD6UW80_9AGAR|nr:hypothetical protein GGX14DRAFT_405243 [Mycena pura]